MWWRVSGWPAPCPPLWVSWASASATTWGSQSRAWLSPSGVGAATHSTFLTPFFFIFVCHEQSVRSTIKALLIKPLITCRQCCGSGSTWNRLETFGCLGSGSGFRSTKIVQNLQINLVFCLLKRLLCLRRHIFWPITYFKYLYFILM